MIAFVLFPLAYENHREIEKLRAGTAAVNDREREYRDLACEKMRLVIDSILKPVSRQIRRLADLDGYGLFYVDASLLETLAATVPTWLRVVCSERCVAAYVRKRVFDVENQPEPSILTFAQTQLHITPSESTAITKDVYGSGFFSATVSDTGGESDDDEDTAAPTVARLLADGSIQCVMCDMMFAEMTEFREHTTSDEHRAQEASRRFSLAKKRGRGVEPASKPEVFAVPKVPARQGINERGDSSGKANTRKNNSSRKGPSIHSRSPPSGKVGIQKRRSKDGDVPKKCVDRVDDETVLKQVFDSGPSAGRARRRAFEHVFEESGEWEEYRPQPFDPSSEQEICRAWRMHKKCLFGDNCRHLH
ncbi:hypothetical protein FVE85_6895 [Porphyridium purpureum]|uniref:C3H1-type domain-containing protein n=1 Tax=Porphyridium purpureum TaxID=35688 RepID=A0A5J4Z886_PORPP|nr:hypothetical protein FVE85_6895 [Porphyridium purpureum]|eukprot:POR1740..scf295_1